MCTTVLLFGATALRADVFSFSYAGASVSASGTLTATALGLGAYTVTNITGIRNTTSFNTGATGLFYYPTSNPLASGGLIAFNPGLSGLAGLLGVTVSYASILGSGYYQETSGITSTRLTSFSITSSVPEASTLLLLCMMGLGVWILARKLPSKETLSR